MHQNEILSLKVELIELKSKLPTIHELKHIPSLTGDFRNRHRLTNKLSNSSSSNFLSTQQQQQQNLKASWLREFHGRASLMNVVA